MYFEAGRLGIKADTQSARVSMGEVFRRGWYHLIPLGVLIFALLVLGLSAGYSALFALGAMLSIGIIRTFLRERRFPLKELKDVCLKTARTAVPVSLACASAGIVIGIVSMTGLGVRFTQIVVELSGGRLFPMLLLIMVACIVLGMGLPSTAAYVIAAAVGAPALLNAGIPALGANLFVFYFAIISFITPPVASRPMRQRGWREEVRQKRAIWRSSLGSLGSSYNSSIFIIRACLFWGLALGKPFTH